MAHCTEVPTNKFVVCSPMVPKYFQVLSSKNSHDFLKFFFAILRYQYINQVDSTLQLWFCSELLFLQENIKVFTYYIGLSFLNQSLSFKHTHMHNKQNKNQTHIIIEDCRPLEQYGWISVALSYCIQTFFFNYDCLKEHPFFIYRHSRKSRVYHPCLGQDVLQHQDQKNLGEKEFISPYNL